MYYGSVENDSGEDWKDVQLSLSTATPSSAAKPPALKTLYASAEEPYKLKKKGGFGIVGFFGGAKSSKESHSRRMETSNALYVDYDADEAERGNVSAATTDVGTVTISHSDLQAKLTSRQFRTRRHESNIQHSASCIDCSGQEASQSDHCSDGLVSSTALHCHSITRRESVLESQSQQQLKVPTSSRLNECVQRQCVCCQLTTRSKSHTTIIV